MPEIEDETFEDAGEPTEVHDIELPASAVLDDIKSADNSELIKVQETVSTLWRGVSGCCDQARVDKEWRAAIDGWVQKQKAAHSNLIFVSVGWGQAKGECRKWENYPNGRKCNGTLAGPAWAYFRPQA